MLMNLKAQDWHQMTEDYRNTLWRELSEDAYPSNGVKTKEMSNDELDLWLKGVLGG